MSENRVKEIQEFVDKFNKDLSKAYTKYEAKQKKIKNIKKCYSQLDNRRKTEEDKLPSVSKKTKTIETKRYNSDKKLIIKFPEWKPPKGIPDYFEEFKGLKNKYELTTWEKVCKYLINFNLIL